MKYNIFTGKDEQFYFRFTTDANENVLKSEGYAAAASRNNGIESVKKHSENEANYEKLVNNAGKFTFNVKARNGQVIATSSKSFDTEADRDAAIALLVSQAKDAVEAPE